LQDLNTMKNRIFYCAIFFLTFGLFTEATVLYSQTTIWEPASMKFRAAQIFAASNDTLYAISGTPAHIFFSGSLGTGLWQPVTNDVNVTSFAIGPSGHYYVSSPLGLNISADPINGEWTMARPFNLPDTITALFVRGASDGSGDDEIWAGTVKGLWYRKLSDTVWVIKDNSASGSSIQQITTFGKNIYYRTSTDLFVSNDGGGVWHKRTQTSFGNLTAILAPSAHELYQTVTTPLTCYIFHSTNDGVSFDAGISFARITIQALAANNAGDVYFGGGIRSDGNQDSIVQGYVRKIPNGSENSLDFSSGFLPVQPSGEIISFGVSSGQILFAGTDSDGVWRTIAKTKVNSEFAENGIQLSQNYPNPVNTSTEFSVYTDHPLKANITVFDALGRNKIVVMSGDLNQGNTPFRIDTRFLANGTYFYRLQSPEAILTRSFVVSK
jgi:hypothetical protein